MVHARFVAHFVGAAGYGLFVRFGVLGPLAVWTSEGRSVRVPERKVRALLADLLVHDGRPVSAERLLHDLWGEQLPGHPGNTLQTKVSQLRKALEDAEPGGRELVVHQPPGYRLRAEACSVDARQFRALIARARASAEPRARAGLLSEALALFRGPVLADVAHEPFAAPAIRALEEERLVAVEERAEALLAPSGPVDGALLGELEELVTRHPLRERLRAVHMRALHRAGRPTEALTSFSVLRRRLVDELGLEPGPELSALQQAVLAQDPALAGPPAPARARTNLPARITELVGRAAAVQEVHALLGRARLVTLTGPGGVGKTSLAVETARRHADAGGDAWLVELAGIDRQVGAQSHCPVSERLVEVVAAAVGVRDDPGAADLVERLAEALRAQEALLVLDNCEQVVEQVAAVAQRLLHLAPGLRILTTSREPLGVTGEVLWNVAPLELPERGTEGHLASVREAPAVQLFVARAAEVAPGFTLDHTTAPAVAAICRRLDGIPLAMELAATRVRALGVHELLRRLDDRFGLLSTGARGAPARQQTLRAMIDWSWELLTPPEQVVLRRLAVHAESCGLSAAEEVCADQAVPAGDVLTLLTRLVDRSLVVAQPGPAGEPRFRLLETVAAYCLHRVAEAGEAEPLHRRHARHYLELAEHAEPLLRGPEQGRWLERLDTESANLRAAFEHVCRQPDGAEPALRLVAALSWYWLLRGRVGEARRSLRRALAAPGAAPAGLRAVVMAWELGMGVLDGERAVDSALDPVLDLSGPHDPAPCARARWFVGYALTTVGHVRGEQFTESALTTFRALDDRWGVAAALVDRMSQAMTRGDLAGAGHAAAQAADLFGEVGDRWGQVQASYAVGTLASIAGDYERAAHQHRAGLRMAEELGLWAEVSYQLSWLGRVALLTGRLAEGRQLHEQAVRMAVDHGFAPGRIYAETGLALGARRAGDLDAAEEHLHTLLGWHGRVAPVPGADPGNALLLAELGFVAELRGDAATALRLQLEGFAAARRLQDPRAVALAMEGLAGALALAGEPARAARLLGAAAAAREAVGAPLPEAERGDVNRITATARGQLGDEAFTTEFERGAAAQPDDLVQDATAHPRESPPSRARVAP
ncbi:BTAD domain-containing putative transcriptional regulator [Pseudonocardia xinjiangensis]|uniref:BTAD domain-containing putative transcriptional regulator n=1 Tax=Pseudonocardia xinjiangensis TaxID=75289 RepID=UPI003D933DD9